MVAALALVLMSADLSLEARVMAGPARAFREIASEPGGSGPWIALRRPLFLALVLGCVVSLATSGVLTLRLVGPATLYWAFVPLVEVLALAAVTWRRRGGLFSPRLVDVFFVGHGPWTLYLLALAAMVVFLPPQRAWEMLTTWGVAGLALVVAWSVYIDFCFFRHLCRASRGAASRTLVLHRLLTWLVVIAIVAVPGMKPWGVVLEMTEAVKELLWQ